jgi:ferritin-like metal-binding protein YciE
MAIENIEDLFLVELQHVYDAEKQLAEALPQLAQAACTPQLRQVFDQQLAETKEHTSRLEEIFKQLGEEPTAKPNLVMTEMRRQADEMRDTIEKCPLLDAALIVTGNQIEHFVIASYGSLRTFAQLLGNRNIASILEKTLQEEKQADARLTDLGTEQVNIQALHTSEAASAANAS